MKFLVVNAHWNNRGDEAAVKALLEGLHANYPAAEIVVQQEYSDFLNEPWLSSIPAYPSGSRKRGPLEFIELQTLGRVCFSEKAKTFFRTLGEVDVVIHAPGGPSIGDVYFDAEPPYLRRLEIARRLGVPYVFFAPSAGPFAGRRRRRRRRLVYEMADLVCLREEVSSGYVRELTSAVDPVTTLDAAFMSVVKEGGFEDALRSDAELDAFIGDGANVIGVTVTDLQWNGLYSKDPRIEIRIRRAFTEFIKEYGECGFRFLFIPQLFGSQNDSRYMETFDGANCFVMSDAYDSEFQQNIIGRLYAVVGMRYHSNIFAAKMATPFVSVAYEQKMTGFMAKAGLSDYCLPVAELRGESLRERFDLLTKNYDGYRRLLLSKTDEFRRLSLRTMDLTREVIDRLEGGGGRI